MATAEPLARLPHADSAPSTELADQWRRLTRAATAVAVLTSPALFIWFKEYNGWSVLWSLAATAGVVIVFRGFADLLRRLIPWPSLFGADSQRLRDEDVMGRRRAWYWRKKARLAVIFGLVTTIVWLVRDEGSWLSTPGFILGKMGVIASTPALWAGGLRLLPLHRQLRDPDGTDAADGHLADPRLRARRRAVGRQARGRPRPGRGQGGGAARRHALAVGRGVRARGR